MATVVEVLWVGFAGVLLWIAGTVVFDTVHWLLHLMLGSRWALLRGLGWPHGVHHRWLDGELRTNWEFQRINVLCHLIPEYLTQLAFSASLLFVLPPAPSGPASRSRRSHSAICSRTRGSTETTCRSRFSTRIGPRSSARPPTMRSITSTRTRTSAPTPNSSTSCWAARRGSRASATRWSAATPSSGARCGRACAPRARRTCARSSTRPTRRVTISTYSCYAITRSTGSPSSRPSHV